MVLDHECLDVYSIALDFMVFAHEAIARLPRGGGHLADQLTRASTSIVLNLAEGAGKLSKADERRYYLTARALALALDVPVPDPDLVSELRDRL